MTRQAHLRVVHPKPRLNTGVKKEIKTVFYADFQARHIVRTNRAYHANSAVLRAIDHMQMNHYEAVLCEVYDERDGVLHAVIKGAIASHTITILFQREVKEGM